MYQSRLIQTMFFVSLYEFDTKNILLRKKKKKKKKKNKNKILQKCTLFQFHQRWET